MVSSLRLPSATKNTCEYDLQAVQALVQSSSFHFAGTRTFAHLVKMGFDDKDVVTAFLNLTPNDFRKSHQYEGIASWHDVYFLCHTGANGCTYDLYIKFRLSPTGALVLICSFHPEGWE